MALTFAAAMAIRAPVVAAAGATVVLQLNGSIQPAALRYLKRGLAEAGKHKAALVVIEVNTPGGTLAALREMTAAITSATPPVGVYVTPAGARAASAGFFLLVAADYGAMAPGTNAGAAHPVALGARDATGEKPGPEQQKATNDAAALARSLAAQRGRPVELAEEAVTQSRAFSAREALQAGLIDSMAPSRKQFLSELDGRTVRRFDGREQRVTLRSSAVEVLAPSAAERFLMKVSAPAIAYLLLMLGGAALLIELLHPGMIVPGVVGGIAVLLALYAFSVLPVSLVGAILLAVAFALFVAEVFVASFGALAIGGLVCFVFGSMMLFETGEQPIRLSLAVVLPVALVIGATILVLVSRVIKARRAPNSTGAEALIWNGGRSRRVAGAVGHGVRPRRVLGCRRAGAAVARRTRARDGRSRTTPLGRGRWHHNREGSNAMIVAGTWGLIAAAVVILVILFRWINVLREYERGVVFRLGRVLAKPKGPGLVLVLWPIDRMVRVSLRTEVESIPAQDVITRDNVSVKVNAVLYFRVIDPTPAIINVKDYLYGTSQLAQTTLRSVLGTAELDDLLAERDKIDLRLQEIIDRQTEPWA